MTNNFIKLLSILFFSFFVFGCSVRTYTVQKDRVDQDLSGGNRGYAQDRAPAIDESKRCKTRPHTMIEVEMGKPAKSNTSSAVSSQNISTTTTSSQSSPKIK